MQAAYEFELLSDAISEGAEQHDEGGADEDQGRPTPEIDTLGALVRGHFAIAKGS